MIDIQFIDSFENVVKFSMIQTNWYEQYCNTAIAQMWKNLNFELWIVLRFFVFSR